MNILYFGSKSKPSRIFNLYMTFIIFLCISSCVKTMDGSSEGFGDRQLLLKKKLPNIIGAQFIGCDKILLQTKVWRKGAWIENIFLYNSSLDDITHLEGGPSRYDLRWVDSLQSKGVLSCCYNNPNSTTKEKILIYDFITQKKVSIRGQFPFFHRIFFNDETDEIVLQDMNNEKVYRLNGVMPCLDAKLSLHKKLSDFLKGCGSIFYYDPKKDIILSYCRDKSAYYYGSIENYYKGSGSFTQRDMLQYYPGNTMVKIPLLVFFDRKISHHHKIVVLNVLENTCISIDYPDPIASLGICDNKKVLVTLSPLGRVCYINIAQGKCIYDYETSKEEILSENQREEMQASLLSFSADGKKVVTVSKNNFSVRKVPYEVLYGMSYKQLMTIIFALGNMSVYMPKELRNLLVFKMVRPFLP